MSSQMLFDREKAEVARGAAEASHIDVKHLRANERQVARYLHPPADTIYALEYSYYLLGEVQGKTVLEYGCGDGMNTLILARRGAKVKALDISPQLIKIARQRLSANNIAADVEFIVGSAHDLPLSDNSVDIVFGIAILHHLDLALSAREVKRVLRKGGRAIFHEPMRNSKVIQACRGLIPYQAPDVSPYEKPLTDKQLEAYADGFSSYSSKAFFLPTTSLVKIIPFLQRRFIHSCYRMDAAVLRNFPTLSYYSTVKVVEMIK